MQRWHNESWVWSTFHFCFIYRCTRETWTLSVVVTLERPNIWTLHVWLYILLVVEHWLHLVLVSLLWRNLLLIRLPLVSVALLLVRHYVSRWCDSKYVGIIHRVIAYIHNLFCKDWALESMKRRFGLYSFHRLWYLVGCRHLSLARATLRNHFWSFPRVLTGLNCSIGSILFTERLSFT